MCNIIRISATVALLFSSSIRSIRNWLICVSVIVLFILMAPPSYLTIKLLCIIIFPENSVSIQIHHPPVYLRFCPCCQQPIYREHLSYEHSEPPRTSGTLICLLVYAGQLLSFSSLYNSANNEHDNSNQTQHRNRPHHLPRLRKHQPFLYILCQTVGR